MRRVLLVTLVASLLAGCGTTPTAATLATKTKPATTAPKAAAKPVVSLISAGYKGPAPTVMMAANKVPAAAATASEQAVADILLADSELDSIELLLEDGGAYFVQGWWTDFTDWVKRTWTRWKLSWEIKATLKHSRDKAFDLHEGEIDNIKENRSTPVTHINDAGQGAKEIVTTWQSTNNGTYDIETRRIVDDEGVTQVLGIVMVGKDKKDLDVKVERVRTLMGEDGTYKVTTKLDRKQKDGRNEHQEWTKLVKADGSEKILGFIDHPDGYRTEITGTRDTKGKVDVQVSKIASPHS